MLSLVSAAPLATPLTPSCAEIKTAYQDTVCCGDDSAELSYTPSYCPNVSTYINYPAKASYYSPCPAETYYREYSDSNEVTAGYAGCVSENGDTPCGWMDTYDWSTETYTCTEVGTFETVLQTVRGGSPTMSEDMMRLTGAPLPVITYPFLPMTYPNVKTSQTAPMLGELKTAWKELMTYQGSTQGLDDFAYYPDYGAEQGMVMSIAIKVLEMAKTTCNRAFYALLEAPAYGYDWSQAVAWADVRSSSFYAGEECPCYNTSTCNDKGVLSISQRGWSVLKTDLPTETDAFGVEYTPDSADSKSPWFQTNVIPGNPIGRFGPCKTPREKCICDGVYFHPTFIAPEAELFHIPCYSWAFSITKIMSAQFRAGVMLIQDYPDATSAAGQVVGTALSIANGLMSSLQLFGQIKMIKMMMEKPLSDPTSWLGAMRAAQYEKWDVMDDAFATCQAAGVVRRTSEQPKYFGAYLFNYMMPPMQGLSKNVGAASNDFFKTVIGYDHFNYYWGWRGEPVDTYAMTDVDTTKINNQDFVRIHMFRDFQSYAEEARRMKLVCSDFSAKVAPEFLSVDEWMAIRTAEAAERRRLGAAPKKTTREAAQALMKSTKMSLKSAVAHAKATDPDQPLEWEYGLPSNMDELKAL